MSADAPQQPPSGAEDKAPQVHEVGQPTDPQQQILQQQYLQQEQLRYVLAAQHQQQRQIIASGVPSSASVASTQLPPSAAGIIAPPFSQLYVQGIPAMQPPSYWPQATPQSSSLSASSGTAATVAAAAAAALAVSSTPHLYVPPHLISSYHHQQQAVIAAYQQEQAAAVAAAAASQSNASLQSSHQQQQLLTVSAASDASAKPQTPQHMSPMLKNIRPTNTPQPHFFSAQNESNATATGMPTCGAPQPAPSPSATSSIHDEVSMDGSKFHSPSAAFQPPTPLNSRAQNAVATPSSSAQPNQQPCSSSTEPLSSILRHHQMESVEKLVNACTNMSPHLLPRRRQFFERLILLLSEKGETLSSPPQVSKSVVDLYSLYEAVRKRGGFEQVTKDKGWKQLCSEANPFMQESSAAGYQLRKHYQRFLLVEECRETGQNADDLVAFAERQKKKKKEKDTPIGAQASPIRTPDARHTPSASGGGGSASGTPLPPRQTQTPAISAASAGSSAGAIGTGTPAPGAGGNAIIPGFHLPLSQQGITADNHPPGEYNSTAAAAAAAAAATAAAAAVSGAYYYPGHHNAHAAWASAQHAYPPPPQGAYHPSIRGVLPPGMRPIGELTEEQQRQQYYQHQQQQAVYAAHFQQQQQLMAVAAAQQQQLQQQQQQQQPALTLHVPSDGTAGSSRGASCSTTPLPATPARTVPSNVATDSRAPSAGPSHNVVIAESINRQSQAANEETQQRAQHPAVQIRPPSHQPPRHTPTPCAGSYSYPASANAPTPPLTISTQQISQQQASSQSQATPQPSQQQPAATTVSSSTVSATIVTSTAANQPAGITPIPASQPPNSISYYVPPGVQQTPYAMAGMRPTGAHQLPPGVRPPSGLVMYGGEIPYAGMYPQQALWAVPSHSGPHQPRYAALPQAPDYSALHQQQQQQLRNQQQAFQQQQQQQQQNAAAAAQQQQQQYAEAQRRAVVAASYYPPPPGSVAAPPPAVLINAASTSTSAVSVSHSPGSVQRVRPGYASAHVQQQQQQIMAARAVAAAAAASGVPLGYAAHHYPVQAAAAAAAHMAHGQPMAPSTSHSATVNNFPTGSIEAVTTNPHLLKRRRPKMLTRDYSHTTPKRLLMALRSGMHIESTWAINTLNVILYDDTIPPFNLASAPELLNAIVEHFIATLSLLFPKHFKTSKSNWLLNLADDCSDGAQSRDSTFNYVFDMSLAVTANVDASPTRRSKVIDRKSSVDDKLLRHDNDALTTVNGLIGVFADAKQSVRSVVRPPMGRSAKLSGASATANNYTRISRTGRRVYERECQLPVNLAKLLPTNVRVDDPESSMTAFKQEIKGKETTDRKECNGNVGGQLADRLRDSLLNWIESEHYIICRRPRYSDRVDVLLAFWKIDTFDTLFPDNKIADCTKKSTSTTDSEKMEKIKTEKPDELLFRRATDENHWGRNIASDSSLVLRPPMFNDVDALMQRVVDRCLALSNILRGFSFLPGHERILCQHSGLLRLLATILRLFTVDTDMKDDDIKETDAKDDIVENNEREKSQLAAFVPKTSDARRLLIETTNHLRDDAFTIFAHISVQLDLFDEDGEVSWAIFDALLYWGGSTNLQARDPMLPGVLSPRSYTLEILCKMSVIERNVDLLLSTGPWARIEEFVRVLCSLINLEEELPYREFAIVILNAICAASEPACYVAAMETSVLNNLVSFLELADTKMHQIVQQQGMPALRENPELMGTSVGMLRRATLIMLHIARLQPCRKQFSKLQCRLLTFTTSHFMDSRVAAMVADILFEMQRSENNSVDIKFGPTLNNSVKPIFEPTKKNDANCKCDDAKRETKSPTSNASNKSPSAESTSFNGKSDCAFKAPIPLKRQAIIDTPKTAAILPISDVAQVNGSNSEIKTKNKDAPQNVRKRPLSPYETKCREKNDGVVAAKKTASESVIEKLCSNIIHKHVEDPTCGVGDSVLKKTKLVNGAKFLNHIGREDSDIPNNHENRDVKQNGQRNNGENATTTRKVNNNNTLNNKTSNSDTIVDKSVIPQSDNVGTMAAAAAASSSSTPSSTTVATTTAAQSQSSSMTAVA